MATTHDTFFERAKKVIPGGVHSPVRSFKGIGLSPRFIYKADGAYLFDEENKNYIDFCMSFGPLILGHQHPADGAAHRCRQAPHYDRQRICKQ